MVLKVYVPVPAVKVPLFVIPPLKLISALILLVQLPPVFTVIKPSNLFVPAVAPIVKVPDIDVVPLTVKVCETVREEFTLIIKLVQAPLAETVTVKPFAKITVSFASGKPSPSVPAVKFQVPVAFQFPLALEVKVAALITETIKNIPKQSNLKPGVKDPSLEEVEKFKNKERTK
ncbi:hypothetical protein D3C85_1090120 [compost metagenome]